MKKLIVLGGVAMILSGCAAPQVIDPEFKTLPGTEVETGNNSANFFESVTFNHTSPKKGSDGLEFCVAQNVENRSVSLTGEASSHTNPLTGTRYTNEQTRESGGGQVIRFVSDDGSELVATGTTSYSFTFGFAPIERVVRYKLTAEHEEEQLTLIFSSLEQAQIDTGVMANSGFDRLGVWEGSGATHAYHALKNVAEDINSCLNFR